MTIRQQRNMSIIKDYKAMLGQGPVMDIYYRLSAKYFLDAETIRAIIRKRETLPNRIVKASECEKVS